MGTLPAGSRVGPWVVEAELGRGGFGAVYRAHHAEQGGRAALKLIALAGSGEEVARVGREVEALTRLSHPGLVRLLDQGRFERSWYLAMELVEGTSLQERVRRAGPLGPRDAARLVEELARACEHVHRAGLVHRDVKPENVIIQPDGRPRLIDFGLARVVAPADAADLTATGLMLGTPAYLAPEQSEGGRADARADVYGLGATLYFALTGEPPFQGADTLRVLAAQLHSAPQAPGARRAGIPPELERVCLRCLERDPAARWPSALALAQALAAAREPRSRGPSLPLVAASLVALGLLAALGLVLLRRPPTRAQDPGGARAAPAPPPPTPPPPPPPARPAETPSPPPAPPPSPPPAPAAETSWLAKGEAAGRAGDRQGALRAYDRAIAEDPENGLAFLRRGAMRVGLGDLEGAEQDLDRAVALRPEDAMTWATRGMLRRVTGDARGSVADCDRALELDPGLATALVNRAGALDALGDPRAEADYERALQLSPGMAAASYGRANLRGRRGDLAGARADLDQTLQHAPTFLQAWIARGDVRRLQGDLEGALADWTRALELDPRSPVALLNRGTQLAQLGRSREALPDLDAAVALAPQNGLAWLNRAGARLGMGDVQGATADLERALELLPADDPNRPRVEAALAEARRTAAPR